MIIIEILFTVTPLNRSLTSMQWLKGMQLKDEKPSSTQSLNTQYQNVQWTNLSPNDIAKVCSVQMSMACYQYSSGIVDILKSLKRLCHRRPTDVKNRF